MLRFQTDTELLAAYRAGDIEAFRALYLRHHRRLWAQALSFLLDFRETEDLLVEAMRNVAAAARQGRIKNSFLGYAITTVHTYGARRDVRPSAQKSLAT